MYARVKLSDVLDTFDQFPPRLRRGKPNNQITKYKQNPNPKFPKIPLIPLEKGETSLGFESLYFEIYLKFGACFLEFTQKFLIRLL